MNALARELHALDSNLAPVDTISLQEQVDRMSYTQRLAVSLLAIFGGMALFLAAIGLYAVMSYSVSQSTRELGLRMALGASADDVLRLIFSRALRLTTIGLIIGAIAALLLTRLMENLLYKVSHGIRSHLVQRSSFLFLSHCSPVFFPHAARRGSIPSAHCGLSYSEKIGN
jgi:putative ABC transport system permease protein